MSVVVDSAAEGKKYYVKGAVEVVLERCKNFYDNSQSKMEILDAHARFASQGLRVIALAYGDSLDDLTFVGLGNCKVYTIF
jgi:Ca2+-transporting ATPase